MRTPEESSTRWQHTISRVTNSASVKDLARLQDGENICVTGLRSLCWKIFLQFDSTDVTTWSNYLKDSRGAYALLKERYLKYIDNPEELGSVLDPLNDDKNSPWNTLRQDEELRAEIQQDVERCMPDEEYFRQPQTQRMLLDILFIFCKLNQDTGYRQGMHELLAPILWVIEEDSVLPLSASCEAPGLDHDALRSEMLNAGFIEHDAFTLFTLIMRTAKSFYELGEPDRKNDPASTQAQNGASPIVERSKRIHEELLGVLDPELASHLTAIDILPQIFLIRWIRLLFGREFGFESLLSLWDILFAEDPALDLVDLICVAMLLRIRWQLLAADYSVALMLLLKYPTPEVPNGPPTFVEDAIYLKNNFNRAAGTELIAKYSGKAPLRSSENAQPTTPKRSTKGTKEEDFSRSRSPLPSPARFIQQQGGVEAFLQGAARGVFARGEKLGINRAVREAVGEVRKNMQGLAQGSSGSRRNADFPRWSLDDGRTVPSASQSIATLERRNKQLASMLDEALTDLRKLSSSENDNQSKSSDAIDLAIAKVQFVQVYLEDSTMPLPTDPPPEAVESSTGTTSPQRPSTATANLQQDASTGQTTHNRPSVGPRIASTPPVSEASSITKANRSTEPPIEADLPPPRSETDTPVPDPEVKAIAQDLPVRKPMPVPTRSSIAQSSFAFMLEPDEQAPSAIRSTSPKSSSPFLASGRKPVSARREKAAFLFGEDADEADIIPRERRESSVQPDRDELFNLTSIKSPAKGG